MNESALRTRSNQIAGELEVMKADLHDGRITKGAFDTRLKNYHGELREINDSMVILKAASKYSWGTEADMATQASMGAGMAMNNGSAPPGTTGAVYCHLPSPKDASPAQWKSLADAMMNGTPVRTQVMPRPASGMSGTIAMKTYTPALESGITGSPFAGTLPPIMSPYAVGMAYDPLDIATLFPAVAMTGPSATQIVHSSNTAEAAIVPEAAPNRTWGPGSA